MLCPLLFDLDTDLPNQSERPSLDGVVAAPAIKQAVPMFMLRASCSNAQAFANRMSRASVTGANGNARMSANPFETESI